MSATKCVYLFVLFIWISGCGLQDNWTRPTFTAPPTSQPTNTHIPLPDLEIISLEVRLPTGDVCYEDEAELNLSFVVQNTGSGPAGTFKVAINEEWDLVVEAMAAGDQMTFTLPGFTADVKVTVDVENVIIESNEDNNIIEERLAKPTQR